MGGGDKEIQINYNKTVQRISSAKKKLADPQCEIRLLAVSKKQSLAKIAALYHCGHRDFAENYCQELEEKVNLLKQSGIVDIAWSFIGRLQSNKIKKIVSLCCEIQSLSSLKHAKLIHEAALNYKKVPFKVYLLVNLGEEASKSGLSLEAVDPLVEVIEQEMKGLSLEGLMAIPPKLDLEINSLVYYQRQYERLAHKARSVGKGKLSLGMSFDLELAISCGSNCVRVGTGLFGVRD